MRAWQVAEKGHPSTSLRLVDIQPPEPGPGEALIRARAGTINFADILLCQGIYQDRPPLPFVPGLETSGVVEACGPGVELEIGAHVGAMSALPAGGFAEYALIRAGAALVFPKDIPFPDLTLLYSTYQTSHVALFHRGGLREGEWLLVLAGASGVGSAAIQLGRAVGARVIAAAGSAEKLAFCKAQGADHVVDYTADDAGAEIKRITGGRGVDVVFDPVGGAIAETARRSLAWEGRYLVIGFAGGDIPQFPANHVLVKNYSVVGVHWGVYHQHRRDVIETAHEDILRRYAAGEIRPAIARTLTLDGIPEALEALEARSVAGRLVVTP
ncbi:MAG: NADPH:quinone oxidoreductase family protein [Minwuia sp.]|uniref:NADPH:quinone oxidoreductase family protein n=1 Tax=Minwuia sp. TaxID=2493630 RepID=UPI003A83AD82